MKSHRASRYHLFAAAVLGILAAACAEPSPETTTATHAPAGHAPPIAGAPHWEYEGEEGPEAWGALSPEFATCSAGRHQSPIDLAELSPAATNEQRADFPPAELEIRPSARPDSAVHNGHTIQVDFPKGDTLTVGGEPFELVQFHFHAPSEHTVAGRHLPMEIHFVHRSGAGKLAVLGVLVEQGAGNAAFEPIASALPKSQGSTSRLDQVAVNLGGLLPKARAIYRHEGSLTTPPCSEQVSWLVMTEAVELSAEQISTVSAALPENSRPVQPPYGRAVVTDELAVRVSTN